MSDSRGVDAGRASADDDAVVPVFGTWRNIYTAVVATELVVLALIALFQLWSF